MRFGKSILRRNHSVWILPIVLFFLITLPAIISLTGNLFGPFLAAYISTALVMYGLIAAIARWRSQQRIGQVWVVLAAGIVSGLFTSLATDLGAGIYAGFLVGQAITVGLVLWLTHIVPIHQQPSS